MRRGQGHKGSYPAGQRSEGDVDGNKFIKFIPNLKILN